MRRNEGLLLQSVGPARTLPRQSGSGKPRGAGSLHSAE
jgi:hypothetical protein